MGQYLSSPITEKETLSGKTDHVHYGISSHQGWRKTQEDAHIALALSNESYLFGVFDGHGGPEVAKFCSIHLPEQIREMEDFQRGDFAASLVQVFHRMDDLMRSDAGRSQLKQIRVESRGDAADNVDDTLDILRRVMAMQRGEGKDGQSPAASGGAQDGNGASGAEDEIQAGCTAVVALLHRRTLYVANAGDSRAVLSRGNVAIAMSEDHKPAQSTERERIVAAGGFLSEIGGITRVNGNLNLSRAIGDLRYKMNSELEPSAQIITAQPDVECFELTPEDQFMVLACDGIWDVMSNQQVVDFVREELAKGHSPTEVASELLNKCLASDPRETRGIGCDNMTCCIVLFQDGLMTAGASGDADMGA